MRHLALAAGLFGSVACGTSGASRTLTASESGDTVLSCPDDTSFALSDGQAGRRGHTGSDYDPYLTGVIDGSLTLGGQGSCAWAQGVTEVTGSLTFVGTPCEEIDIPELTRVGGVLQLSYVTGLPAFSMLTSIDNYLSLSYLHSITTTGDFPLLERVGGSGIGITDNEQLVALGSFHALTSLGGAFAIADNPNLCTSIVTDFFTAAETRGVDTTTSVNVGNKPGC